MIEAEWNVNKKQKRDSSSGNNNNNGFGVMKVIGSKLDTYRVDGHKGDKLPKRLWSCVLQFLDVEDMRCLVHVNRAFIGLVFLPGSWVAFKPWCDWTDESPASDFCWRLLQFNSLSLVTSACMTNFRLEVVDNAEDDSKSARPNPRDMLRVLPAFTGLRSLTLHGCDLNDIVSPFAQLKQLRQLAIISSNPSMTNTLRGLELLPFLQQFHLAMYYHRKGLLQHCDMDEQMVRTLEKCPSLTRLSLKRIVFPSYKLRNRLVANLKHLTHLNLNGGDVRYPVTYADAPGPRWQPKPDFEDPAYLEQVPSSLTWLDIRNNEKLGQASLGDLKNVQTLLIGGDIDEHADSERVKFTDLLGLPNLQRLYADLYHGGRALPAALSATKTLRSNLTELYLDHRVERHPRWGGKPNDHRDTTEGKSLMNSISRGCLPHLVILSWELCHVLTSHDYATLAKACPKLRVLHVQWIQLKYTDVVRLEKKAAIGQSHELIESDQSMTETNHLFRCRLSKRKGLQATDNKASAYQLPLESEPTAATKPTTAWLMQHEMKYSYRSERSVGAMNLVLSTRHLQMAGHLCDSKANVYNPGLVQMLQAGVVLCEAYVPQSSDEFYRIDSCDAGVIDSCRALLPCVPPRVS